MNTGWTPRKFILVIFLSFVYAFCLVYLYSNLEASIKTEKYYQDIWCKENNGKTEVILSDQTRCDCVTKFHAIEVDFGKKWTEAIGQALHYSLQTGKRAGIVLIIKSEKDERYWNRMNAVIEYFCLPIDVWKVK